MKKMLLAMALTGCATAPVATGPTIVVSTQLQVSTDQQNWTPVTNLPDFYLPDRPDLKQVYFRAVVTQSLTNR